MNGRAIFILIGGLMTILGVLLCVLGTGIIPSWLDRMPAGEVIENNPALVGMVGMLVIFLGLAYPRGTQRVTNTGG